MSKAPDYSNSRTKEAEKIAKICCFDGGTIAACKEQFKIADYSQETGVDQFGTYIILSPDLIENKRFAGGFLEDGVHVKADGVTIRDCHFYDNAMQIENGSIINSAALKRRILGKIPNPDNGIDKYFDDEYSQGSHRDAVQIIPSQGHAMLGALINDFGFYNNIIESTSFIQGVFMSDGMISNFGIACNTFNYDTSKNNILTLTGALSGYIGNNYNIDGELLEVILEPLRLGGGSNVYIIGFAQGEAVSYREITGNNYKPENDHRQGPKNRSMYNKYTKNRAIFLKDFRLKDFMHVAANLPLREVQTKYGITFNSRTIKLDEPMTKNGSAMIDIVEPIAILFGKQVFFDNLIS